MPHRFFHVVMTIALYAFLMLCLLFVIMAAFDLINPPADPEHKPGTMVALLVMFLALGGGTIVALVRLAQRRSEHVRNRILVLLAQDKKMMLHEAALKTKLPPSLVKKHLEAFCTMGLCELHLTPEGNLLYAIRESSSKEKEASFKPDLG